jgi:hypothetical protein
MRTEQKKLVPSLGMINISSFGLWVGSVGQALLLTSSFPAVPLWVVYIPLLGPWILVFVLSFCQVAPCGPRRFYQILMAAMCWYVFNTLVAELAHLPRGAVEPPNYPIGVPHLIILAGAISFVVLIRAVIQIRRYELSLG